MRFTYPQYYSKYLLLSISLILALMLAACATSGDTESGVIGDEPIGASRIEEAGIEDEGIGEADIDVVVTEEDLLPSAIDNGVVGLDDGMILASVLLGSDIYSLEDEDIGDVQDLLIDGATGNILFAQVEHDGIDVIASQKIMVPLSALQWSNLAGGALRINIDPLAFANWPGTGEEWPDVTSAGWHDEVIDFWESAGVKVGWDGSSPLNNIILASTLIDTDANFSIGLVDELGDAPGDELADDLADDVGDDTGGDLDDGIAEANLEDLVIDLAQGQVRYALVSTREDFFTDLNLRALPFTALNITVDAAGEPVVAPNVGMELLAASPVIALDAFEGMLLFGSDWDDLVERYWADRDYLVDSGVGDEAMATMGVTGVLGADNILMPATSLLDRQVANIFSTELGEIEDIYIDASTGNVLFVTLERGGFLGIGEEALPVPLTVLTWNAAEETLVLPITEDLLESFPAIEEDWETTLEPGWREVSEFWRNADFDTTFLDEANLESVVSASEMVGGYGVGAFEEPGLGIVQDFLLDLRNSKVQYILLSFREAETFGVDLVPVPFSAFDAAAFGDEFVFAEDFDRSLLNDAPRFTRSDFAAIDVLDPTWDDALAAYWAAAGYGISEP